MLACAFGLIVAKSQAKSDLARLLPWKTPLIDLLCLTVESGRVPEGVQVFLEQDADAGRSRSCLFMCAFLAIVAAVTGVQGGEPLGVLAIAIFAAMAAVMAIPTAEEEPRKPRVIVLCDKGWIVREHWGLRNFRYDELTRVFVLTVDGEQQLCIEDKAHGLAYFATGRCSVCARSAVHQL